ncbi:hypothetical protein ACFZCF_26555 [Streptomyces sp. NPDC007945]|uniref:hypothetical protein n=1 Tax=Streptomyces sp. NPDC007945 TaxID=3364797 RepID=UPI0036E364B4
MLLMRGLQDAGCAVAEQTTVVGRPLGPGRAPCASTCSGGKPAELVDDAVHGTDVETSTRFLLYSRVVRREPGGTLSVGA